MGEDSPTQQNKGLRGAFVAGHQRISPVRSCILHRRSGEICNVTGDEDLQRFSPSLWEIDKKHRDARSACYVWGRAKKSPGQWNRKWLSGF